MRSPFRRTVREAPSQARRTSPWALALVGLAAGSAQLSCGDNLPPRTMDMMEQPPTPFLRSTPINGKLLRAVDRPSAVAVDSEGKVIYLVGRDSDGAAQLYSMPVAGGTPTQLSAGVALEAPTALAIDTKGNLFVADPATDDGGAIYKGGTSGALARFGGNTVRSPVGLAISDDGQDLYVTGRDPMDNQPAVFKISTVDGTPTMLVKGAPLGQPSGIALSNDGKIYVVDSAAVSGTPAVDGAGAVIRVDSNSATIFSKAPLRVGFPAGLAATGQSDLLVNSNAPGAAGVFIITSTGDQMGTGLAGDVINVDGDPAGLYQAARANVWVALDTATPPQATPGGVGGSVLVMTP